MTSVLSAGCRASYLRAVLSAARVAVLPAVSSAEWRWRRFTESHQTTPISDPFHAGCLASEAVLLGEIIPRIAGKEGHALFRTSWGARPLCLRRVNRISGTLSFAHPATAPRVRTVTPRS